MRSIVKSIIIGCFLCIFMCCGIIAITWLLLALHLRSTRELVIDYQVNLSNSFNEDWKSLGFRVDSRPSDGRVQFPTVISSACEDLYNNYNSDIFFAYCIYIYSDSDTAQERFISLQKENFIEKDLITWVTIVENKSQVINCLIIRNNNHFDRCVTYILLTDHIYSVNSRIYSDKEYLSVENYLKIIDKFIK